MQIELITNFEILFEDDYFVAIDKPAGILVHRTPMSRDKVFVLQLLSQQIGEKLYPIHRLDRPTSGVLIFAKSGEYAGLVQKQMQLGEVEKEYFALVRGWFEPRQILQKSSTELKGDFVICKSPLPKIDSTGSVIEAEQEAETWIEKKRQVEIPIEYRGFKSIRYSMLRVIPKTGRTHQIRRHLAHLRSPIVGDTRYGDLNHNKIFKEKLNFERLWLHSYSFCFFHPVLKRNILLCAKVPKNMELFGN
jgi:tRNA pseudouridine65 synthase